MDRVSLSRLPGDRVHVRDGTTEHELSVGELAAYFASRIARRLSILLIVGSPPRP